MYQLHISQQGALVKNYRIREYDSSDVPALKALWQAVFGDPSSLLDRFFLLLPQIGSCCIAESEGHIIGAAYILTDFVLRNLGQTDRRCAYLYAVATEETWRGNGIGRAVSIGAADLGRNRGAEMICTLPAEKSLYDWYASILNLTHTSTRSVFFSRENSLLIEPESFSLRPVSESVYLSRREELLRKTPHIIPGTAVFSFQAELCRTYGGGLYQWHDGVLCAYVEEDSIKVVEFLSYDGRMPSWLVPERQDSCYICSDMAFPDGIVWNLTLD